MKMLSSRETISLMLGRLIDDVPIGEGEQIFLFLNSFGTTVAEELILYKDCKEYLESRGIILAQKLVGRYFTTEEQNGFQLSITRWDDELERLWNTPVHTPYFDRETLDRG